MKVCPAHIFNFMQMSSIGTHHLLMCVKMLDPMFVSVIRSWSIWFDIDANNLVAGGQCLFDITTFNLKILTHAQ